jgi:hypothetical protein
LRQLEWTTFQAKLRTGDSLPRRTGRLLQPTFKGIGREYRLARFVFNFAFRDAKMLAGRKLAVSFHVVGESGPMTWHAKALQTWILLKESAVPGSADLPCNHQI